MRYKKLVQALEKEVNQTAPKHKSSFGITGDYINFRISSYTPKQKILNKKSEDRLGFENIIRLINPHSQPFEVKFKVVFDASQTVHIHFLQTTRDERRWLDIKETRKELQQIFEEYIENNIDFWELYAKIYIK